MGCAVHGIAGQTPWIYQVGEWVAVRALAGWKEAYNEDGSRQSPPFLTAVEWLTVFHVVEFRIVETRIISVVEHSHATARPRHCALTITGPTGAFRARHCDDADE
ncbi:hypothetical protein [Humibacillus xanthopallidus]|uniref:Uncharacterized protein n=1 Tax=Humibacillus xanthopallidus TaxID=412689 RepID=A0A543HX00_9MICO|nr:hypothetical protein [Humibacillus xanthopallidus]TQM62883.1 hypothetical protein FBY41_2928 [Humibacillus xanthopallidus]